MRFRNANPPTERAHPEFLRSASTARASLYTFCEHEIAKTATSSVRGHDKCVHLGRSTQQPMCRPYLPRRLLSQQRKPPSRRIDRCFCLDDAARSKTEAVRAWGRHVPFFAWGLQGSSQVSTLGSKPGCCTSPVLRKLHRRVQGPLCKTAVAKVSPQNNVARPDDLTSA